MDVLIAMDSFKGSLTSIEAGEAAAKGCRRGDPGGRVRVLPLADGGEGTTAALIAGLQGEKISAEVSGPLGMPVTAEYGIVCGEKGKTAVMEIASCAGLPLIPEEKRNPLYTSTRGVGEMILDGLKRECRRFLIGIGGSGTNDGGSGMLKALGFDLVDKDGREIPDGAEGLEKLEKIRTSRVPQYVLDGEYLIACDVRNPLLGDQGASAVFGPQKGAGPEMVQRLECLLNRFARITEGAEEIRTLWGEPDPEAAGSGAAGGLGFAFRTFLGAELRLGAELVMQETGMAEAMEKADILITGEGRIDRQTCMGKAPGAAARLAKKKGKLCVALGGSVEENADICNTEFDGIFPVLREISTLEEAIKKDTARRNVEEQAFQIIRLLTAQAEKTGKE